MVRRSGAEKESSLKLEVRALGRPTPDGNDAIWRTVGLKTTAVSPEYVAAASSRLRGGLFVQAVRPGSPAARANIARGDILVGMNVGEHHWETIKPDNILYIVRKSEAAGSSSAQYYIVRRNAILQGAIEFSDRLTSSVGR